MLGFWFALFALGVFAMGYGLGAMRSEGRRERQTRDIEG